MSYANSGDSEHCAQQTRENTYKSAHVSYTNSRDQDDQKKIWGKNEHEKSTAADSVRRSPIQVLTGFAMLNFTEKTRALCFHPIRTDMQKCWK